MWISSFAVKNPVITVATMLAIVVFGLYSLMTLETDEFPEINPPIVSLSIPYPGASPENVERDVVEPVEDGIASISGVKTIRSTALDGFAVVIVEFQFSKDIEQATQDTRDKLSELRPDLPEAIEEPVLTRFDPNELPIVSLTLTSSLLSPAELTRLADPEILGTLRSIAGVADVTLAGDVQRELTVELNPDALAANRVAVAQVVAALRAENVSAPVGRVTGDWQERTIRLLGRLATPNDFEQLTVATVNGQVVRLRDVAAVHDGTKEPRTMALFNGEPAVGIDVKKTRGFSTTEVSARILAQMDAIQRTLPEGVHLRVVRDAGVRVARSVSDVQQSLLEGAALTVVVVFLFLASWRSTVITGLALPVSVLAGFIAVKLFGFTLNTLSLLGLSLAIGILIDDAIVVRENIVRHMQMGAPHTRAALEGTAEIGLAVAATTFSIVVVFLPVAFMGGLAQQWFAPLALTIAASVLMSLFVSFSLDPMLSAIWPDPEMVEGGKRTWLSRRLARFDAWFARNTARYGRLIGWGLRHRLSVGFLAVASLVIALALPAVGLVGIEFIPQQDRSEFTIHLDVAPGSNIEFTRAKAAHASAIARRRPEVAYTYSTIGGQTGAVDTADVFVKLLPRSERQVSQRAIAGALRTEASRIAGVRAEIATSAFGGQKQIQLELAGPDLQKLDELAQRILAEVRQVPGAVDVSVSNKGPKPELEVRTDRGLAGILGVTTADIAQALRPAFAGLEAGDWVDPSGETRDVVVRLAPGARTNAADVRELPILVQRAGAAPRLVPLGQVATVTRATGPTEIGHLDENRVITIGANAEGRPLNAVVGAIQARLARISLPPGYAISPGGNTEDQREVFTRIFQALGLAVILMYLVLVMQFRSFLDPISILASLPLSLIGVVLALFVTGSTINLMSLIGLILLMGIVAKNAILLIDFAKWAKERGVEHREAIIEAGKIRLRPIIMTSAAIVAGMTPVALGWGEGAEFRAPLGRAVIGGVIASTILTLIVIPTFYDVLSGMRDALRKRFRTRARQPNTIARVE